MNTEFIFKVAILFGPVLVHRTKCLLSFALPHSDVVKLTVKLSSQKSRLVASLATVPRDGCARGQGIILSWGFLSLICSPEFQEQMCLSALHTAV